MAVPNELLDLKPVFKKYNMSKDGYIPMPIEFCFPEEIVREAMDLGILRLTERFLEAKDGELAFLVSVTAAMGGKLPDNRMYFAMKIEQDTKMAFAEWVAQRDQDAFRYLRPTIEVIRRLATQAVGVEGRGTSAAGDIAGMPLAASPSH